MILGLNLALASALATNLAFLFKHRCAVLAPPIRVRHPVRSAIDLFRSKWFLVGWTVAIVAWGLHDRQRRERERADVQTPGHDRHDPADQEPRGAEEIDGAAQRMANQDRWREHRAAVLEQKGEVGGHRRGEREDQSRDHDKWPNP